MEVNKREEAKSEKKQQDKMKLKIDLSHKSVAILTIAVIIIGIAIVICSLRYKFYSTTSKAFILSWILIGTFILSLIFMDYMTYKSKNERNKLIGHLKERKDTLIEDIEKLRKKDLTDDEKKQLAEKEEELKEIKEELLSYKLEPVGVLDKHEIRRSLTISITITYFVLLSLSIFGIGELKPDSLMIDLFTKVFLVMIAFYFGSRAVEEGIKLYAAIKEGKGEKES